MAETAETLKIHQENKLFYEKVAIDERVLSEVDNINNSRLADGTILQSSLTSIKQNLFTASQEAAMPYAVSTTRHEYLENKETGQRTFSWLGKTAVQAAMSGYSFHSHPEAIKRVDVEVDEARNYTENLDTGVAKVFISPRMTRADASIDDARKEHLGDDDAIRVSWLESDSEDNISGRVMQSILVRDIPFAAWTSMLRDEDNIFGKSIELEDDDSALSVMKVHRQLEMPLDKLPNGPIDILEAVVEYVEDDNLRNKLQKETKKYYKNQDKMTKVAEEKASEWLDFEIELANSLYQNKASHEIVRFINVLQHNWSDEDLSIINNNYDENGGYTMTRELAVVVESARQNLLWSSAAIEIDNKEVKNQVNEEVLNKIAQNNQIIAIAKSSGMDYSQLEAQTYRLIAGQKIDVGGGCPGKNQSKFKENVENNSINQEDNRSTESSDKIEFNKYGKCRVKSCGKVTYVGPCDVCRTCQAKFDEGDDPTKRVAVKTEIENRETNNRNFWEIINNNFEDQVKVLELKK